MVDIRKKQPIDDILQRNEMLFREKIMSSREKMLALSRYSRDDTLSELGLGTEVFVTLVLALADKDLYLSVALLKLAETLSPLLTANRYIVHQMLEMFQISLLVVQEAIEYLKKLDECQLFNIPGSIGAMLRHATDNVIDGQSANERSSSAVAVNLEEQGECSRTEESSQLSR